MYSSKSVFTYKVQCRLVKSAFTITLWTTLDQFLFSPIPACHSQNLVLGCCSNLSYHPEESNNLRTEPQKSLQNSGINESMRNSQKSTLKVTIVFVFQHSMSPVCQHIVMLMTLSTITHITCSEFMSLCWIATETALCDADRQPQQQQSASSAEIQPSLSTTESSVRPTGDDTNRGVPHQGWLQQPVELPFKHCSSKIGLRGAAVHQGPPTQLVLPI